MPRPPSAGKKWVSVELDIHDYDVIVAAAKVDRRSLNTFLQVQLGELAAKLEFDKLLKSAGTMQEQTKPVQEQLATTPIAPAAAPVTDFPGLTVRNPPKAVGGK
jgi:hypothetical protein